MKDGVIGVIPVRYQSSRFPGKPLVMIHGKPMVHWVYRAAKKVLAHVIVATDDKRILNAVHQFGGKAMMTPRSCRSGTDRMAHVARKIRADFYVNIQGDEPLMSATTISGALGIAKKFKAIGTAATELKKHERKDRSAVKVVLGHNNRALYFSRTSLAKAKKHLGIYVYPRKILGKFVSWKPTKLEKEERLEQLRALHYGVPIYVSLSRTDSIGVDTPEDLKRVKRILMEKKHG